MPCSLALNAEISRWNKVKRSKNTIKIVTISRSMGASNSTDFFYDWIMLMPSHYLLPQEWGYFQQLPTDYLQLVDHQFQFPRTPILK